MGKIIMALMVAVLGLGGLGCSGCGEDHSADEALAKKALDQWMVSLNKGEYGECWDKSAEFLRKAIGKEEFIQKMDSVLSPLGKMIKREPESAKYMKSLPGAPDGAYVVFQFRTTFENKEKAIETITPMKCRDGAWRVSGYYLK